MKNSMKWSDLQNWRPPPDQFFPDVTMADVRLSLTPGQIFEAMNACRPISVLIDGRSTTLVVRSLMRLGSPDKEWLVMLEGPDGTMFSLGIADG
jgi:hypothetical protein